MMKKALVALAFSGMAFSAQAGLLLDEGFDEVRDLAAKGWIMQNASNPIGGAADAWFQGSPTVFSSQGGDSNSYAASSYFVAGTGGTVDAWLISPEFSTGLNGAIVSFWLRADAYPETSDQIAFGFSNGSSELGDFVLASPITVGTDGWVRYSASIGGGQGNARFALQYAGAADFVNYVGLDSFQVSEVPEPTTTAILFVGAMGLAMSRRRKRG